jgi:ATP-dependent exoDNAse (exonuclease V) beta subunit
MTTVPTDQSVRDAATSDLEHTIFLEASAGTGKTSLLVERVVALVMQGRARMDQIAAITFTEAAAAELRDRLSQRFDELAGHDPDGRAAAASAALDVSAVTTLHGFARKILAEHPLPVGLPPSFDVADASASRVAFDQRWHRFVDSLLRSKIHEELVARALSVGMTWPQLRQVAICAEENWELLDRAEHGRPRPTVDAGRLVARLEEALSWRAHCSDPGDRLAEFLEQHTSAHLTALRDVSDELDLLQVVAGLPPLGAGNRGQKGRWMHRAEGRPVKDEALRALAQAEVERARLMDDTVQWVLSSVFDLIVDFTLEAAEERRRSGHLAFHDLLVVARQLVRDHPAARRELQFRFTHLLIDEFQDTDPLQVDLALRLGADASAEVFDGAARTTVVLRPGGLFFVGDPKQSIYRFRRADIEVFMKTRDSVGATPLQLSTNFRSRPGIVEWVNAVFGAMMGDGVPGAQPGYQPLTAFADSGEDPPHGMRPVILLGREPVDGPVTSVRQVQAGEVAAAIATMRTEAWPIGADAHPLRYADVAILVRSRTGLPLLEAALSSAGVPYRLESSSLVYHSAEVAQLLAILRAVDDPTDAVNVLAALRSPAFGCADDELCAHRAVGGTWDPSLAGAGTGPVAGALAELRAAHAGKWWKSVSTLVSDVVVDHNLLALALTEGRPRESWRRIRFLLDQARLFDESHGGDLRGFLRWVDHQQEEGAQVTEAILPESDDDAVRISTMHAAKGLEFPVTVLLGLETQSNNECPSLLFTDEGPQLCVKRTFESPGYAAALVAERQMDRFEQRRLCYVAATRARDILMVSLHRPVHSAGTLAAEILEQCTRCPETWVDGSVLARPTVVPRPTPAAPFDDLLFDAEEREHFAKERAVLLEHSAVPRTIAATSVHRLARESALAPMHACSEPEGWEGRHTTSRGRAGTAVGRAVHAVLQAIDLASGADLSPLTRTAAATEGIPERAGEVGDLVRSALESDVIRQAVAMGTYWREVYVGVPVGGRVLEGFIDLLFETPAGLVVVDYKTDRSGGDDHEILDRYGPQGASYALAAQLSLGRPVSTCIFLILSRQGAREVALSDLSRDMAEVEDLLQSP